MKKYLLIALTLFLLNPGTCLAATAADSQNFNILQGQIMKQQQQTQEQLKQLQENLQKEIDSLHSQLQGQIQQLQTQFQQQVQKLQDQINKVGQTRAK